MEHTRIDEGIPRGKRVKPSDLERQARDEAGKFLTRYSPEIKEQAIQDALIALECGARVEDVCEKHSVPVSTMYSWLVGNEQAKKLRTQFFDGMTTRNLCEIRTAQSPLELARAREELSGWLKVAERRDPHNYGVKQEVTHNLPNGPLLNVVLSPGLTYTSDTREPITIPSQVEPKQLIRMVCNSFVETVTIGQAIRCSTWGGVISSGSSRADVCGHIYVSPHISTGGISPEKGGMSICRSCHTEHDSWIRCEVAARRRGVVVNEFEMVVNAEPVVVNGRTKDRHKMTPERREYIRQKMREYRARGR